MANGFRTTRRRVPLRRVFVNRCIMCGRIIPMGYAICASCNRKRIIALRRRR